MEMYVKSEKKVAKLEEQLVNIVYFNNLSQRSKRTIFFRYSKYFDWI